MCALRDKIQYHNGCSDRRFSDAWVLDEAEAQYTDTFDGHIRLSYQKNAPVRVRFPLVRATGLEPARLRRGT